MLRSDDYERRRSFGKLDARIHQNYMIFLFKIIAMRE